jgi:hypothetical protein
MRGLGELPWRPFAVREMPRLAWASADPCAAFRGGRTQWAIEFDVDCWDTFSARPFQPAAHG